MIARFQTPFLFAFAMTFMIVTVPCDAGRAIFASAPLQLPMCWINAKTGKKSPLPSVPEGSTLVDPNHAYFPGGPTVSGTTFVRLPDGSWINAKTGKKSPLPIVPEGSRLVDPKHAYFPGGPTVNGTTFVLVPCLDGKP